MRMLERAWAPIVWVASLAVLVPGCGGAMHVVEPERREEVDALEARIDEQALELSEPALACGDRCRGTGAICDAAARICEIAREERDADLDARCDRAQGRCTDARGRIDASCACEADTQGTSEAEPL